MRRYKVFKHEIFFQKMQFQNIKYEIYLLPERKFQENVENSKIKFTIFEGETDKYFH